jgi:citrate synthase
MRYQGTDIDGPCLDPEGLIVRGVNLVDIIGHKTFLECFFLTTYDRYPNADELGELNRYFSQGFGSIKQNDPLFDIIPLITTAPQYSLNGLMAGLTIDRQKEIEGITPPRFDDIVITEVALAGFYFMSVLPVITGFAAAFPFEKDSAVLKQRLELAQGLEGDYIDKMVYFLTGKPFNGAGEKVLIEAILVSFCAGFGYLTPSIMSPRISIGSGVSVGLAIIAGCTTAGPWHLGTSQDVIMMFQEMLKNRQGRPIDEFVNDFIQEKFQEGKKLLGFGHPFFKKDPRVLRLMEIVDDLGFEHEAIDLFHSITLAVGNLKNIYPNLETAHGALLTSMGFNIPFLGPSIALIGRAGGMVAHMEERLTKPAFGVRNDVARNFFDKVPMGWL